MVEEMIPIVMFVCMAVVLGLLFWFRYRARNDMQQTLRAALDKGQELTPELVDRLGHTKPAPDRDLRLGVIWLAIASGLVLIGLAVPEEEAFRGTLAGAALPACIGSAYLLLHKLSPRNK